MRKQKKTKVEPLDDLSTLKHERQKVRNEVLKDLFEQKHA